MREAIGPRRVVDWHNAYATAGPEGVHDLPRGQAWSEALDGAPLGDDRHLVTFEGHVTHLFERDRLLLPHIDVRTMVGPPDRIRRQATRLAANGYAELICMPTGPDVPRELAAFASAVQGTEESAPSH